MPLRTDMAAKPRTGLRHRLAVYEACQVVRDAVWRMADPGDTQILLEAVEQALSLLEIPYHYWGINLVGDGPDSPVVAHSLAAGGRSFRARHASRLIWETWERQQPAYRTDLLSVDAYSERAAFEAIGEGPQIRSVLDMPFSHGTLALSSPEPNAFTDQHLADLGALSSVIGEGLKRLDELSEWQAKNEQLTSQLARNEIHRSVRQALWSMQDTKELLSLLTAIRQALDALGIPYHTFGINLISATDADPVTQHNLQRDGYCQIAVPVEPSTILAIWRSGRPVLRSDLLVGDPYHEASWALQPGNRIPVRCILDVPFSCGTIAVNSDLPDAFTPAHIASLVDLATVVDEGFRRVRDLTDLEARNRELQRQVEQRQTAEARLQLAHDELEARVRERTQALAESSQVLAAEVEQHRKAEAALMDRLDFQRFLSNLSTRLLGGSLDQIDGIIDSALAGLGERLGVDRVSLCLLLPEKASYRRVHEWSVSEAYTRTLPETIIPYDRLPQVIASVLRGDDLRWASRRDIPQEWVTERSLIEQGDTRAFLVLPLKSLGAIIGFASLISFRSDKVWDDESVHRARLICELLCSAIQRRESYHELRKEIGFQSLVASVAGRFVNVPADAIATEIQASLGQLALHLGLDYCDISFLSEDHAQILPAHFRAGQAASDPLRLSIDCRNHRWLLDPLLAGDRVYIPQVALHPEAAALDRLGYPVANAQSVLLVPLRQQNQTIGILTLASFHTSPHEDPEPASHAFLLASIYSNALLRLRSEESYRSLIHNLDGIVCTIGLDGRISFISDRVRDYGFVPEDITGSGDFAFVHAEDRPKVLARIQLALSEERILEEPLIFRIADSAGEIHWLEVRSRLQRDANGELLGVSSYLRDITLTRRIDEERQHALGLLNAVFELASIGFIVFDVPEMRIRMANTRARQFFGVPLHLPLDHITANLPSFYELTRPDGRLVTPDSRPVARVVRGEVLHGEEYIVHPHGKEPRWLSADGVPVLDQNGNTTAVFIAVTDITARRTYERHLIDAELKYRSLFEGAADGILLLQGNQFVDCNARALELFRATKEQLIDSGPADRSPDLQRDGRSSAEAAATYIGAALSGVPQKFEWQHLRLDGTCFDAEVSLAKTEGGNEPLLHAIVRDITQRRLAEVAEHHRQRLLQAEAAVRLRIAEMERPEDLSGVVGEIGRQLTKLGIVHDSAAIQVMNRGGTDFISIGLSIPYRQWDLLKEGDWVPLGHAAEYPWVLDVWRSGKSLYQSCVTAPASVKGLSIIDVAFSRGTLAVNCARPYAFDPDEALPVLEAIARVLSDGFRRFEDLVARERLAQELEQQRALSIRTDRLRSLGEMSASIAHELNQPLVGVRGLAEHILIALERGWQLTPDILRQRAAGIMLQADRMTHIIDHVRAFSNPANRRDVSPVELNEVAQSAVDLVRAQFASHGIELRTDLTEGLPPIRANLFSLEEVLINLLNNARDAVEEMTARDPARPGHVCICTCFDEDRIELQVRDSGVGIPPEILERLFEPFFTTKHATKGTGLGLPICRTIVEDFGGTITIESSPGQETVARIRFPAIGIDG